MNKYLIKIAAQVKVRDKLEDEDVPRAFGRGVVGAGLLGAVGHGLGRAVGAAKGKMNLAGAVGAGLGFTTGVRASMKNQLREQQVHDIKLQGAAQRQESHDARMHKMAFEVSDQTKKDVVGTGTIAALGGVGNLLAHKVSGAGHSGGPSNAKVFAIGTGIGLAADYAGLKISHAYNKYLDRKQT